MSVLKTYLRVFTTDLAASLAVLEKLFGRGPDYRFKMPEAGLEIVGIGDCCLVAGTAERLAPLRATQGPLVVDDLAATKALLSSLGAVMTAPEAESETGRYVYFRHPDGTTLEYVQWKPEVRKRVLG